MKTTSANIAEGAKYLIFRRKIWQGRLDSNQGMAESRAAAINWATFAIGKNYEIMNRTICVRRTGFVPLCASFVPWSFWYRVVIGDGNFVTLWIQMRLLGNG